MSSILNYSQPDFYHFAEDSIILAKFAAQIYPVSGPISIADLFAGCGVVGLEFTERRADVVRCDFFEITADYQQHLEKNISNSTRASCQFNYYLSDLFRTVPMLAKKYSVILANPPFYDTQSFRAPLKGGINRARCRMWTRDEQQAFIALVAESLREDGKAFILVRHPEYLQELVKVNHRLCINALHRIGKISILEISLNVK